LGELTALPVNSSLSVFSFDHEWPFSFPQEEKKMGIQSCMVSPCLPEPQSGTLLHPCGGSPHPSVGAGNEGSKNAGNRMKKGVYNGLF